MTGAARPLGRYTPTLDSDDPALYDVRLLAVPVRLFLQARERHDELLREFSLLALSEEPNRRDVPARFLELVQVLGVRYGGASARPDEEIEQALADGLEAVDLSYTVPASVVDAAGELEHWLVQADEFCAAEQLLTLPRTEALKRLASWYFNEFRRQVAGERPQPWDGPLAA